MTILVTLLVIATSCNDYLDMVPDKRTEVDNSKKVKDLLVSAYPNVDPLMIFEHRTDNVMDNGKQHGNPTRMLTENYHWEDISETAWDGPQALWESCYAAIATANEALSAIELIGEDKENDAYRGEAYLCRAYAHFLLVNTFSQPYKQSTASTDLGIPYVTIPERTIGVEYDRGTVQSTYEKISRDIEAGYDLINDNIYEVPLYHFNKKAAAAFAARFYLFYQKYNLALKYANEAIDKDPSSTLRDFNKYLIYNSSSEWLYRFISKDEPANLLLIPLNSLWGRNYTSQRYGHSSTIASAVTYRSSGPWDRLEMFDMLWGASGMPVKFLPKYHEVFEVRDEVAQTGLPHVVQMAFTTDETLLVRAEANVMLNKFEEAAQDLSYWYVNKGGNAATAESIVQYYTAKRESDRKAVEAGTLSPWLEMVKPFNVDFQIQEGNQEMMLQAVLHARRIETLFSGLRWLDIRRYGIEVIHNIDEGDPITLPADDLRRVIQLPAAIVSAGMQANPK